MILTNNHFPGTIPLYFLIKFFNSGIGKSNKGLFSIHANTAAHPATCPIAIHEAWTLNAELAKRSLEIHLPATSKFVLPFGIKERKGIVATLSV